MNNELPESEGLVEGEEIKLENINVNAITRNILSENPRVTRFHNDWDNVPEEQVIAENFPNGEGVFDSDIDDDDFDEEEEDEEDDEDDEDGDDEEETIDSEDDGMDQDAPSYTPFNFS